MPKNLQISLIGAGNLGYHLGQRLYECGFDIQQVYSRKISKARSLAKLIKAEAINDFELFKNTIDLAIIAVKDDAIADVAKLLKGNPKLLVVHTSGSKPSTILKGIHKNYGCFYPLQTFSIDKKPDYEALPICIHSPQKSNRIKLEKIAKTICPNVFMIDDNQKSVLHVAAVFANNFSNFCFHIAHNISEANDIDFDILKPLIVETAAKVQAHSPRDMQTGPARRGDKGTMARHLELLSNTPYLSRLYQLLSEGIQKEFS